MFHSLSEQSEPLAYRQAIFPSLWCCGRRQGQHFLVGLWIILWLGGGVVARATPLPQVQAFLDHPLPSVTQALNWDWCDYRSFLDLGVETPWLESNRRGVNLAQVLCSELKTSWELYDRNLSPEDANRLSFSGAQAPPQTASLSKPYFILYNRYTGVMRAFLWVGPHDHAASVGDVFVITACMTHGAQEYQPTHLLDLFSNGDYPSLAHAPSLVEQVWLLPMPTNNVWIIIDLPLAYDPAEGTEADGYENQWFFQFYVSVEDEASIQLSGRWDVQAQATRGQSMLSMARSAYSDGMQVMSSTRSAGNWMTQEMAAGGLLEAFSSTSLATFAGILSGGGSVWAGIAAGGASAIKRLFFDQSGVSVMYPSGTLQLQGAIQNRVSTTAYFVPYSGSIRTQAPLFAFAHPGMRKLGLFHFNRWPVGHYVSEAPSCLISVNPNALSVLQSEYTSNLFSPTSLPKEQVALMFTDPNQPGHRLRTSVRSVQIGWGAHGQHMLRFAGDLSQISGAQRSVCLDHGYGQTLPMSTEDFPEEYAIATTQFLKLNDRVSVYDAEGQMGKVLNLGVFDFYGKGVELGVEATVGTVINRRGQVVLRDRSMVQDRLVTEEVVHQNQVNFPAVEHPRQVTFPEVISQAYFFDTSPMGPDAPYTEDPFASWTDLEVRSALPQIPMAIWIYVGIFLATMFWSLSLECMGMWWCGAALTCNCRAAITCFAV